MKSSRRLVILGLGVVLLCVIVQLLVPQRPPAKEAAPTGARVERHVRVPRSRRGMRSPDVPAVTTPIQRAPSPPQDRLSPAGEPRPEPPKTKSQADGNAPKVAQAAGKTQEASPATRGGSPAQPDLQDPMARIALAYVGADPDADVYWYEAINDRVSPRTNGPI